MTITHNVPRSSGHNISTPHQKKVKKNNVSIAITQVMRDKYGNRMTPDEVARSKIPIASGEGPVKYTGPARIHVPTRVPQQPSATVPQQPPAKPVAQLTNQQMEVRNTIFFLIIDREAGEIIHLVASVCLSACLSELSCLNRLTYDLDFWHEGRP